MNILNGIDPEIVKRFEEIMESKNINCRLEARHIDSDSDRAVDLYFDINVYGIDYNTQFKTTFNAYGNTFQEAIVVFLNWWDKEIVRFNSFNQLTKSNKK